MTELMDSSGSNQRVQRRVYSTTPVGKSPVASSVSVSRSMKSNRASGTMPELILAQLLRKRLVSNHLPGRPDIVYPRLKVVIFVNGCFWHRCPVCALPPPKTNPEFWTRKFKRNVERDIFNKKELEEMGWRVLVVWEHELKTDPRLAVAKITKILSRERGSGQRKERPA